MRDLPESLSLRDSASRLSFLFRFLDGLFELVLEDFFRSELPAERTAFRLLLASAPCEVLDEQPAYWPPSSFPPFELLDPGIAALLTGSFTPMSSSPPVVPSPTSSSSLSLLLPLPEEFEELPYEDPNEVQEVDALPVKPEELKILITILRHYLHSY